jgi:hypothetical protein
MWGQKMGIAKQTGKHSALFPCHVWNTMKKVGPGFPAPRAAKDSAKAADLLKDFNRYRR